MVVPSSRTGAARTGVRGRPDPPTTAIVITGEVSVASELGGER